MKNRISISKNRLSGIILGSIFILLMFIPGRAGNAEVFLLDFDEDKAEFLMLQQINTFRYSQGLPLVGLDENLSTSCQRYAMDMALRDYFDHYSPEGENPTDRARKAGVPNAVSENIGIIRTFGKSLDEVVDALMDGFLQSPEHRSNLVDPNVTHIGIGFYQDVDGLNHQLDSESDPDSTYRGFGTVLVVQDFCRRDINLVEPDPYPEWLLTGEFMTIRLEFTNQVDEVFLRIYPNGDTQDVYEIPMFYRENMYQARFAIDHEGDFTIGIYAASPVAEWFYGEVGRLELQVKSHSL
ncbi:MAG: CAP domain-containing protein [bacterium]|nr:CAP domain-containing protein [bacterium]